GERGAAVLRADAVRRLPGRVRVAEVLRVPLPADLVGRELVEQRRHAAWVPAAVLAGGGVLPGRGDDLPVIAVALQRSAALVHMPGEAVVVGAVVLDVGLRRLPADERDVVVLAVVAGAVVVLEQYALPRHRAPQVGVPVEAGEGRVVGLVLENDQPDVLDRARPDAEAVR